MGCECHPAKADADDNVGWAHVHVNGATGGKRLMPDEDQDLCQICTSRADGRRAPPIAVMLAAMLIRPGSADAQARRAGGAIRKPVTRSAQECRPPKARI